MFVESKKLPPLRSHDHQIQLETKFKLPCIRPHSYPYYQKEEIEKQVREMPKTGIIQPSQSPYSSPILLIRKVDGCRWMYIGYKTLNKDIIKDRYSIPNKDELLDELYEVEFFTKLDL